MTPLPDDHDLLYMLVDVVATLSKRLYPDERVYIHPTLDDATFGRDGDLPTGSNFVFWGRLPTKA